MSTRACGQNGSPAPTATLRLLIVVLLVNLAVSCRRGGETPELPAEGPIIVISIDTLRADRLPVYGSTRVETPAIDAFRRDAILFENAYSHCPMTLPSHVSLLTGQLPYEHGVRNNLGYSFDAQRSPSIPTLLRKRGYATGAAVSAYVLRGSTGLGRAFDFYDDAVEAKANVSVAELSRPGGETATVAEKWIDGQGRGDFFLLFHIFEPHAPYEPPPDLRAKYSDPYDGEVVQADRIVASFLDHLRDTGVYDRATVVLLSDHGEGLGDHGEGEHGVFLYRETIRVPLLLKLPANARAGTAVSTPVQLIDLLPTLVTIAGAETPAGLKGRSLLAQEEAPRTIYSETMLPRIHFGWSELRSLVDGTHQYIQAPRPELYDLRRDPAEKRNVIQSERRRYAAFREQMEKLPSALQPPRPVDPEEAAKLAALGYLGQTRTTADGDLPDPKDRIADLEALRTGSGLERQGNLPAAADVYRRLAGRSPRFADAWIRLATVQERTGNVSGAAASYRAALDASPSLAPDLALSIASVALRTGDLDSARAHAGLALARSPLPARHLLGRIDLAQGKLEQAEREARLVMRESSYRVSGAVLLARVLAARGSLAEALALLDAIPAAESTGVVDFAATRGDLLARLERYGEAEAAFRQEIRAFPSNVDASSRLALLLIALGRDREGSEILESMVRNAPSRETALRAAGTWEAAGNRAAAERWRQRAAQLP